MAKSYTATNSIDVDGSQVVSGGLTIGAVAQGAETTTGLRLKSGDLTLDTNLNIALSGTGTISGAAAISGTSVSGNTVTTTGINSLSSLRLIGGTTAGAPVSGTYVTGDVAVALDGTVYICTTGGTPGSWASAPAFAAYGNVVAVTGGATLSPGVAATAARSDHVHSTSNLAILNSSNTFTDINSFTTSTSSISGNKTAVSIAAQDTSTTSVTKTGLSVSSTGSLSSGTARALYATATGGANNYAAIFDQGNVGINTTAPGATLEVKGTFRLTNASSNWITFQPNGTTTNTTYTWPGAAPSVSNYVLASDTSGTLSWVAQSGGALLSVANTWSALQTFGNGEITIGRTDTGSEGGQINLNRSSDNATYWYIDTYGNTANPFLRFFNNGNTARMALDGATGYFGVGTMSPAAALDVAGTLRLNGTNVGTNWTEIKSAASPTANVTYTLPPAGPASSGYVLSATTTGVMSWVTNGSGTTTNALTIGSNLTGTSFNGSSAVTIALSATPTGLTSINGITIGGSGAFVTTGDTGTVTNTMLAGSIATSKLASTASTNTINTLVLRDGSGNFSAGTITAALTGNASTATTLQTARTIQGVSFDGSANITVVTQGTGVTVSGTQVSIGQAVSTTSNVTFNDLIVSGNLTVSGTTTTVNSTVTTIQDPIIDIGGASSGAAPSTDDSKDRGITFQWHNGTTAKRGFFGFQRSSQKFSFVPDATISGEIVSGSLGSLSIANVSFAGSTSGTIILQPVAVAGSNTITLPATTGTVITSGDTSTVTNTMLAGSIANNKLLNSSITVNSTAIALGGSGTITAANPNALTISTGLSGTSYDGSSAVTISLDLGNANTWTATQTFSNATSAIFGSGDGTGTITGGLLRAPSGTGTNIAGGSLTIAGGASTGTGARGAIIFQTAPAGTTGATANALAERMRVAASGNVGIGTNNPLYPLHINGALYASAYSFFPAGLAVSSTQGVSFIENGSSVGNTVVTFDSNTNTAILGGSNINTTLSATASLKFLVSTIEHMRITSAGNVGIGTTGPGTKLEVYGSITSRPASTQDAIIISGRAGGTSSYAITFTPATLSANQTITFPDSTGTVALQSDTTYIGTTAVTLNRASANLALTGISSVNGITVSGSSGTFALQGDTQYIGTTAVTLNRASANLALTGISSISLPGSVSGTIQLAPAPTTSNTTYTLPAVAPSIDGQVLSSTTTGVMTWVSQSQGGGGTLSSITINNKTFTSGKPGFITAANPNPLVFGSGISASKSSVLSTAFISELDVTSNTTPKTVYTGDKKVVISIDSTIARRADTVYIGTTPVSLNRSSSNIDVTGLNTIQFPSGLYKSTIKGSSASTTSYTLTLPPDAGSSGQSLTTDGSGTLAWQSAAITSTTNTFSATQNFANIVATGTLTIVSSAVTAIENPTINIGGGAGASAPVVDDSMDRGIEFQWFSGAAKRGFFGWQRSTGMFTLIPDATSTGGVYSGTSGQMQLSATSYKLNTAAEATAIGTPANGYIKLYWKTDGNLYTKNSQGVESVANFGSSASSSSSSTSILNVQSISSSTTLDGTYYCVLCTGTITITLPRASQNTGRTYIIKKIDSGTTITIAASSSDTIDGSPILSVNAKYASYTLISSGTSWFIV